MLTLVGAAEHLPQPGQLVLVGGRPEGRPPPVTLRQTSGHRAHGPGPGQVEAGQMDEVAVEVGDRIPLGGFQQIPGLSGGETGQIAVEPRGELRGGSTRRIRVGHVEAGGEEIVAGGFVANRVIAVGAVELAGLRR